MYALLVTATNWSWEYIDECMTLPRFRELTDYWLRYPPGHLTLSAIAGAFGGGTGSSKSKSSSDRNEFEDIDSPVGTDITPLIEGKTMGGAFADSFAFKKLKVIHIDRRTAS